jgi:integrase
MKRRTGYLVKRGHTYYATWFVNGKRFQQTTGLREKRKAEAKMAEIIAPFVAQDEMAVLKNIADRIEGRNAEIRKLEEERNPVLKIADAWSTYVSAHDRPDSGPATLKQYAFQFKKFSGWMVIHHPAIVVLRDVTMDMANQYAGYLTKDCQLKPGTFNKHIRLLELVFRVLNKPGKLLTNPWSHITRKTSVMQSRRELTTEELRNICSSADGELRLLLALGIYTGMRLGDCATLRWSEVDLTRGLICRIPAKTARRNPKPIKIPIHPVLRTILKVSAEGVTKEYVMPDTALLYRKSAPALAVRIQQHFQACGVRTIQEGTGYEPIMNKSGKPLLNQSGYPARRHTGKRAVVEVGFHSLRHTFVSLCREAHAPMAVVEAIVGHANPAMTRHYTHIGEKAAIAAVHALPSVLGDSPTPHSATESVTGLKTQVRNLAERMTAQNWASVKNDLLKMAD